VPSFIAGVALKERLLPKVLLVLANSQGQYLAFGYLVDVTLGILLSRISASGLPVKAMPAKPRQNFLAISVLLPFCVVTAQSFESCPCLAGPMQRILVPSQNARPCQGLYCRVLEALYCILQKSCVWEYFLVMYWGNVIGENLAIYWRSVIGEVLLEKCYWRNVIGQYCHFYLIVLYWRPGLHSVGEILEVLLKLYASNFIGDTA
jgi:hypothetical protein